MRQTINQTKSTKARGKEERKAITDRSRTNEREAATAKASNSREENTKAESKRSRERTPCDVTEQAARRVVREEKNADEPPDSGDREEERDCLEREVNALSSTVSRSQTARWLGPGQPPFGLHTFAVEPSSWWWCRKEEKVRFLFYRVVGSRDREVLRGLVVTFPPWRTCFSEARGIVLQKRDVGYL